MFTPCISFSGVSSSFYSTEFSSLICNLTFLAISFLMLLSTDESELELDPELELELDDS